MLLYYCLPAVAEAGALVLSVFTGGVFVLFSSGTSSSSDYRFVHVMRLIGTF